MTSDIKFTVRASHFEIVALEEKATHQSVDRKTAVELKVIIDNCPELIEDPLTRGLHQRISLEILKAWNQVISP